MQMILTLVRPEFNNDEEACDLLSKLTGCDKEKAKECIDGMKYVGYVIISVNLDNVPTALIAACNFGKLGYRLSKYK